MVNVKRIPELNRITFDPLVPRALRDAGVLRRRAGD